MEKLISFFRSQKGLAEPIVDSKFPTFSVDEELELVEQLAIPTAPGRMNTRDLIMSTLRNKNVQTDNESQRTEQDPNAQDAKEEEEEVKEANDDEDTDIYSTTRILKTPEYEGDGTVRISSAVGYVPAYISLFKEEEWEKRLFDVQIGALDPESDSPFRRFGSKSRNTLMKLFDHPEHFNKLNDTLLGRVFSFLSSRFLLRACYVCTRWRKIAIKQWSERNRIAFPTNPIWNAPPSPRRLFNTEEVFFDILEEMDLDISSLGMIQGEVSGIIHIRSKLLSPAICQLYANIDKPFMLDSKEVIDNIQFNYCVDIAAFVKQWNVIKFYLAQHNANCDLLKYTIRFDKDHQPVSLSPVEMKVILLKDLDAHKSTIQIHLKATKEGFDFTNLGMFGKLYPLLFVTIPTLPDASSTTTSVSSGRARVDNLNNNIVWQEMDFTRPETEVTCTIETTWHPSCMARGFEGKHVLLTMSEPLKGHCSNFRLNQVQLFQGSNEQKPYECTKWMAYKSKITRIRYSLS